MKRFGLIGKPLTHSFSASYFSEKFERERISNCRYDKYELDSIEDFPTLMQDGTLCGLNVTIPYKEAVIPYLDQLDESAARIGAVNVIRKEQYSLIGYNSDYYGFRTSLERWLTVDSVQALVLGTGGASKAVTVALEDLNIPFLNVSRGTAGDITYDQLTPTKCTAYKLWINTTPLGMKPNVAYAPQMPYSILNKAFFLYDLVYNPEVTQFMHEGKTRGANVKNGAEMLYLQAERSWEIWNG